MLIRFQITEATIKLYSVPTQSGDIEYTLSVKGSHSFNDGPDESLLLPDSLVPCD